MKSIALMIFLGASLMVSTSCCSQQKTTLSNAEINQILVDVDTLETQRNYHVLLKAAGDQAYQVHIWINDRLGGTMFQEAGLNICRFYSLDESDVFIYEYEECKLDIPLHMVRKKSNDQYAYLNESPFYVEKGFYQAFLVYREDAELKRQILEYVDDNDPTKELESLLDFQ